MKKLTDVIGGNASLDDFVEQLSWDELVHFCSGIPSMGVTDTFGFGGGQRHTVERDRCDN